MKKKTIDIDAEFDNLETDFFNEKKIKLRTAAILLKENPEWLEKQASAQQRRKDSGWSKKMIGNKNAQGNQNTKGMKHTEETKKRISESMKGVVHTSLIGVPKPKETCPHCGKIGGRPQMLQFHFDRCKFKKD